MRSRRSSCSGSIRTTSGWQATSPVTDAGSNTRVLADRGDLARTERVREPALVLVQPRGVGHRSGIRGHLAGDPQARVARVARLPDLHPQPGDHDVRLEPAADKVVVVEPAYLEPAVGARPARIHAPVGQPGVDHLGPGAVGEIEDAFAPGQPVDHERREHLALLLVGRERQTEVVTSRTCRTCLVVPVWTTITSQ
jgi:hypothetical protein